MWPPDRDLASWLQRRGVSEISPLKGDASRRRYYRLSWQGRRAILMDCRTDPACGIRFCRLAERFRKGGVRVPEVYEADEAAALFLLEDFGPCHYLDRLSSDPAGADPLYKRALSTLEQIQSLPTSRLPLYGADLLERELELFRIWAAEGLWQSTLPRRAWESAKAILIQNALSQPYVPVHRDYHSRNLMVLEGEVPGVLDFQDALLGPVTYDLVSLLRDCYIAWPEGRVAAWRERFRLRLRQRGMEIPPERFRRWFDLMGVQRHLKAVGIFARLALREGKRRYLADVPRTLRYLETVAGRYDDLSSLSDIIRKICRCSSGVEQLIRNQ